MKVKSTLSGSKGYRVDGGTVTIKGSFARYTAINDNKWWKLYNDKENGVAEKVESGAFIVIEEPKTPNPEVEEAEVKAALALIAGKFGYNIIKKD